MKKCNPFIQQSVNYLCGHQVELTGLWNLLYQSLGSAYKAKIWISHHHWIFTWILQLLILKRKTTSFMVICWKERKKFNVILKKILILGPEFPHMKGKLYRWWFKWLASKLLLKHGSWRTSENKGKSLFTQAGNYRGSWWIIW